jgi:hypothetical protein
MARTYQPSPATQRKTATTPPDTNVPGSFDAQDPRGENGQLGDTTERRENLTAVQDQPDNDRDDPRTTPGDREFSKDREFGKDRDERKQRDEYTERGSWSAQPPTPSEPSAGMDAFAPVLEAWKQVFTSWSQLAETMVKAQQDAFAGMISAANTTAKNINVGDRPDSELAFSVSRATASSPDRIERDRR